MCQGVSNDNSKKAALAHFIPKIFNPNDSVNHSPHTIFYRSND